MQRAPGSGSRSDATAYVVPICTGVTPCAGVQRGDINAARPIASSHALLRGSEPGRSPYVDSRRTHFGGRLAESSSFALRSSFLGVSIGSSSAKQACARTPAFEISASGDAADGEVLGLEAMDAVEAFQVREQSSGSANGKSGQSRDRDSGPRALFLERWRVVRPPGMRAASKAADSKAAAIGAEPFPPKDGPSRSRDKKNFKKREDDEEEAELARAALNKKKNAVKKIRVQDDDEDVLLDEEEEDASVLSALAPVRITQAPAVMSAAAALARVAPPKPSGPKPAKLAAPKAKSEKRQLSKRERRLERQAEPERPDKLVISGSMTPMEFANTMGIPVTDIIKKLVLRGLRVSMNQPMDIDTIKSVAADLEIPVEEPEEEEAAVLGKANEAMLDDSDLDNLVRRPPIVTVMGHVDHGKTTLLDAIRKTKVAAGEAGGITQGVSAYQVDVTVGGEEKQIVFLDTPGHEAFTAMRSRGAKVTDVAILVVAADDGVRPQTIEALKHAQAAGVPIVVAINKIDKEGANLDRVKQELSEYNLLAEDWGGNTTMVPISALKGEGIDQLLELIVLLTDVEDLYANPDRPAKGTCVESRSDRQLGPVASLLVQNGTLRVGDLVVCGSIYGKVRALIGEGRARLESAGPSSAVEIWGMNGVPNAGEEFEVVASEKEARMMAEGRAEEEKERKMALAQRMSLSGMAQRMKSGELKNLNLILKTDVQGSLEAITHSLSQLPQNEVSLRLIYSGVGQISKADVDLAGASEAVIIGFNAATGNDAREAAERLNVDIREYSIIYKLLEEVEAAMEGMLEPEYVEEHVGEAEVRATFPLGTKGVIAGLFVREGKLVRNANFRTLRNDKVVFEGIVESLKRMADDVKEVNTGLECGMSTIKFTAWENGDIIECYRLNPVRRKLDASRVIGSNTAPSSA
eukprot:tig00000842_g4831.t1